MSTSPRPPTGPLLTSSIVSTQWLADHLGADGLEIVAASAPGISSADRAGLVTATLDPAATVIVYAHTDSAPTDSAHTNSAPADSVDTERTDTESTCAELFAATLRDKGFSSVATLRGGQARWVQEERPADLDSLSHLVDAQTRLA